MSLESAAINWLGEKTVVPIGLTALIVLLAIWLTRLDDRVTWQEGRIKQLENVCYHSKVQEKGD